MRERVVRFAPYPLSEIGIDPSLSPGRRLHPPSGLRVRLGLGLGGRKSPRARRLGGWRFGDAALGGVAYLERWGMVWKETTLSRLTATNLHGGLCFLGHLSPALQRPFK